MCRRRPVVATLAMALTLTLTMSFVVVFALWRQSETQRRRALAQRGLAEADYKVARTALAEILELGGKGIESDRLIERKELDLALQNARSRMLELADPRIEDPSLLGLVALVDLFLGIRREIEADSSQALGLLEESLIYWEKVLRKDPSNQNALHRHWETLIHLGWVHERQQSFERSMHFRERAVDEGDTLIPIMGDLDFRMLAGCRISLARLVQRQGDTRARENSRRQRSIADRLASQCGIANECARIVGDPSRACSNEPELRVTFPGPRWCLSSASHTSCCSVRKRNGSQPVSGPSTRGPCLNRYLDASPAL